MNPLARVPAYRTIIFATVPAFVAVMVILAITYSASANSADIGDPPPIPNTHLSETRVVSDWGTPIEDVVRPTANAAAVEQRGEPRDPPGHRRQQVEVTSIGDGEDTRYASQAADEDDKGIILVDNHIEVTQLSFSADWDDAQGFTTGPAPYYLGGVELTLYNPSADAAISVVISEPTGSGRPGTTLYELVAPSALGGKVFYAAPEDAYLEPNTTYLVRIDMTAGSAGIGRTNSTDETALGLPGWSIADYHWSSNIHQPGVWLNTTSHRYAMTIRGSAVGDPQGSDSFTAGQLKYSRSTGESPLVEAIIGQTDDRDWFVINQGCLAMDSGGRYRIDVDPTGLSNADDLRLIAFYVDYPYAHSKDPVTPLTAVSDPPEGYVSWHFTTTRPCSPHIQVATANDATGRYAVRVVYDPVRVWTGTEELRGDLPHDDTTWATLPLDDLENIGVYNYFEDHDRFAVELEDDTDYLFVVLASRGRYGDHMHPSIRLYDDDGNELEVAHGRGETAAVIDHEVADGEGGTYYLDVTNAELHDDPDNLAALGITEPFETYSPFLMLRYYVTAAEANTDMLRSLRPSNAAPRIYNWTALTMRENSALAEYITANDLDAQDTVTAYEISGGADRDLFAISDTGVLSITITPDYEVPADTNADNQYEVQVKVTSGSETREQSTSADFTVTVTDDDTEAEGVLVSNSGQETKGRVKIQRSDSALLIQTGPNADGYDLHSVALFFAEPLGNVDDARVSLWSLRTTASNKDRPTEELLVFTNPTNIRKGLAEFTAPPGTVLDPDTGYYIMVERVGSPVLTLWETASNKEDAISAAEWNIGSARMRRPRNMTGQWAGRVDFDYDQVLLRVIGYEHQAE